MTRPEFTISCGSRRWERTRLAQVLLPVVSCVLIASCGAPRPSTTEKRPARVQDLQRDLIDPALLAAVLHYPRAILNVGPVPVQGLRAPLTTCRAPTRGALRWITTAAQAAMYDMSTYLHAPGTMDGVASFEAFYRGTPPDPLKATQAGLHRCGAQGRLITVATAYGTRRAIQYRLGPPEHSIVTLVAMREGNAIIGVAVSHPRATPHAYLKSGTLASERMMISVAIERATRHPG